MTPTNYEVGILFLSWSRTHSSAFRSPLRRARGNNHISPGAGQDEDFRSNLTGYPVSGHASVSFPSDLGLLETDLFPLCLRQYICSSE